MLLSYCCVCRSVFHVVVIVSVVVAVLCFVVRRFILIILGLVLLLLCLSSLLVLFNCKSMCHLLVSACLKLRSEASCQKHHGNPCKIS